MGSSLPLADAHTSPSPSDHHIFSAKCTPPTLPGHSSISPHARKSWRDVNLGRLALDLDNSKLFSAEFGSSNDPAHLVDIYNSVLSKLADKHAPLVVVPSRFTHPSPDSNKLRAPWFNSRCRALRRQRRRLERSAAKSSAAKIVYKSFLVRYSQELQQAFEHYFRQRFTQTHPSQRWKILSKMTVSTPNPPPSLPPDDFARFFHDKVQALTNQFAPSPPFDSSQLGQSEAPTLTMEQVAAIVKKRVSATCASDPIPSDLLGQLPMLVPVLHRIINVSLTHGLSPDSLKTAIVRPLLKKTSLDSSVPANYRPISALPFLSKCLEAAWIEAWKPALENLLPTYQSAYRQAHSTETALLHVADSLRSNSSPSLLLFDLSAAFDTIDHDLLLNRLSGHIPAQALKWLHSYLTNRSQLVSIGGTSSASTPLRTGVPQGSVLGPILFVLYTAPLGRQLERTGVTHH